jgi:hypothetical protein
MGHTKGPVIAEDGFKVGTYESNTEVLDSSGNLKITGAVGAEVLEEEAGFEKGITWYAATGALAAGKPVYISGMSSLGEPEVSLAIANDRTKAAQFIVTSAATAANKSVTIAPVATVAYASTNAAGTLLYLSATAAGVLVTTAPTVMFAQPIGMVTVKATAATSYAKMYPGYSKAVNPAST